MTQELYFTITGTHYRFGNDIVERGTRVKLVKEPDNEYDSEAIKVTLPGLGQIGYVANSVNTVLGESMSAGRLYDKIGDEAFGTVLYVLERGVVCTLAAAKEDDADSPNTEVDVAAKIQKLFEEACDQAEYYKVEAKKYALMLEKEKKHTTTNFAEMIKPKYSFDEIHEDRENTSEPLPGTVAWSEAQKKAQTEK